MNFRNMWAGLVFLSAATRAGKLAAVYVDPLTDALIVKPDDGPSGGRIHLASSNVTVGGLSDDPINLIEKLGACEAANAANKKRLDAVIAAHGAAISQVTSNFNDAIARLREEFNERLASAQAEQTEARLLLGTRVTRLEAATNDTAAPPTSTLDMDAEQKLDYLISRVIGPDDVPIECKVSPFEPWSDCSQPCGPGFQSRTRTVVKLEGGDAVTCPSEIESRGCEVQRCPVDCDVGGWGNWTECLPSCGPRATRKRFRSVVTPAAHGGSPCPEPFETERCGSECAADACIGGQFSSVADLEPVRGCALIDGPFELVDFKGTASEVLEFTRNLVEVTGAILFFNTEGISDLSMFPLLKRVGAGLGLVSCQGLASADMPELQHIGGDFAISGCPDLLYFRGFNKVLDVEGGVLIAKNAGLRLIDAFNRLSRVGRDTRSGQLGVLIDGTSNQGRLKNITAFGSVAAVGGSIEMRSLEGVSYVTAFTKLRHLGGPLLVLYFQGLVSARWFDELETIEGRIELLYIGKNMLWDDGVTDGGRGHDCFPHFPSLTRTAGQIEFTWSAMNLKGPLLPKLAGPVASIYVRYNDIVHRGDGAFASVLSAGALQINYNRGRPGFNKGALSFERWFLALETLSQNLEITNHESLNSFGAEGFGKLSSVRYQIRIDKNPSLVVCRSEVERFRAMNSRTDNLFNFGATTTCR